MEHKALDLPLQADGAWAWLHRHRWFTVFVIVPALFTAIYYGLIASDIYVSESRFVIKSPAVRSPQVSSIASLLIPMGMSVGHEQALEVVEYIHSRNALVDVSKHVDLRRMFSNPNADRFARYPLPLESDRNETLFRYYESMVDVHPDGDTGTVVLNVKAFDARDAQLLNASLLDLGEQFVNRLNDRAQDKAITESQHRVDLAGERLRKARVALGVFRNSAAIYDPNRQAAGAIDIANKLVSEQAALQAQLDLALRVAPQNPGIPSLRSRIAAIGSEIAAQNGRAYGGESAIAAKAPGYDRVALEQEFATQNYTAATAALEQSRVEAQRQQFYLERVVDPNQPDVAELPHRLRKILTIWAGALCLYFIGWMLVVGILEHAPEN